MKLMAYYVALAMVGNVIAAIFCLAVEKVVPWISMPLFLSLFFLILWLAWVAAVRWTDPERERASIPRGASKQKA